MAKFFDSYRAPSSQPFPIKFLRLAMLPYLIILSLIGGTICWHGYYTTIMVKDDLLPIQQMCSDMNDADRNAQMALRLATASGDLVWQNRFKTADETLKGTLDRALAKSGNKRMPAEIPELLTSAKAAYEEVDKQNDRIFALLAEEKTEEAGKLFSGNAYRQVHEPWQKSIIRLSSTITDSLGDILDTQGNRALTGSLILALFIGGISIFWAVAMGGITRYQGEQTKSETALRESEERFRLIAENARDVIWIMDLNLKTTYISPAIFHLTGYTSEEFRKLPFKDVLSPTGVELFHQTLKDELALESSAMKDPTRIRTVELETFRKDGGVVWTEVKISFVRDSAGRAIALQGRTSDITERKKAEEALRKSEELYRGIIQTADEGVWISDAENRTTFVNTKTADMLGYSLKEMIGQSPSRFMTEEGLATAQAYEDMRRKGKKTHADVKFRRKEGSDIWASVSAAPMFDHEGKYSGTLAMIADITDRKRAEEGNKILADVSTLFLAGKDINKAINTVLDMCGRFDGADRAYVFRVSLDRNRMSNIHEWCIEGIEPQIQNLQDLKTTDFSPILDQLCQGPITIPDAPAMGPGHLRSYLLSRRVKSVLMFPIFIDGRFDGYCGFDAIRHKRNWSPSDVSRLHQTTELIARGIERKRADEALRSSETLYTSLVEQLTQQVFRKNREGQYTFANQSLCQLLGRPLEGILGRTDHDFFPPAVAEKLAQDDQLVMLKGRVSETVNEFYPPNRSPIFIQTVKTPVRDSKGEIVGLQGMSWDITERKQAEEALRAASRMEATATLAGGIAHDFNNLMTGILGNAELLQINPAPGPQTQRKLNIITSSARRGGELAQRLLAFARGGEPRKVLMNLELTIREALRLQAPAITPRIKIDCHVQPDIWNIKADPGHMSQIVMNLCLNAAEAIEAEGRILIAASNLLVESDAIDNPPELKPGPYVSLVVEDNGIGMSADTRAKIFEPFFTTKFQGRGLGLAAIHGIVRNHDGMVTVQSEPGKGSRFTIYLPAMPLTARQAELEAIEINNIAD